MEQALSLEGFKEKKAGNLLAALEKSKSCPLDAFLFALGIPNVGRKTARDLAQAFGTLEKVEQATEEELTAIQDVGEIVAQSITEFFSFAENKLMIDRLLAAGVHPHAAAGPSEGPLTGMTVVEMCIRDRLYGAEGYHHVLNQLEQAHELLQDPTAE